MDATRTSSFRQWTQQLYGPPSGTTTNTRDLVDELVYAKRHRNWLTFHSTSPSKHPLPQDGASSDGAPTSWYDETWNDDDFYVAMTPETTTESSSTNDPTTTGESSAINCSTNPTSLPTKELAQPSAFTNWLIPPLLDTRAVYSKDPPEPPRGILTKPCMYSRLSRTEQLEYLVRWKIMNFRQQLGVPYIFRNMQLWNIDWELQGRRRKFFEKNGGEAYLARYINSDYKGRVEFYYIDPEEVY